MTSTEKALSDTLRLMTPEELLQYQGVHNAIPLREYYDALRLHIAERIKLGKPLSRPEIHQLVGALFDRANAEKSPPYRQGEKYDRAQAQILKLTGGVSL